MTTHPTDHRPYASTTSVLAVLHRLRSRNLPEAIGNEFYEICGLSEQSFGRTRDALLFLQLIDAEGRPTERLSRMAAETDDDYRSHLEEAIRGAYADALSMVSPESDAPAQIQDWFRRYQPRSQTRKMAGLFLGLCKEAGMPVRELPRQNNARQNKSRKSSASSKRGTSVNHRRGTLPDRKSTSDVTDDLRRPSRSEDIMAFGITAQDLAALAESEFDQVWAALGKVAKARANSLRNADDQLTAPAEQETNREE